MLSALHIMMIDEFLTVLSSCVEDAILNEVHNSSTVSILCDESTDVGNLKQMVIFVKVPYWWNDGDTISESGEPSKWYSCCHIRKVYEECKIPFGIVLGFGSDGAQSTLRLLEVYIIRFISQFIWALMRVNDIHSS